MSDYKPNSHKYHDGQKNTPEKKKLQKVVKGTVKAKKKSELQKFAGIFISEDAANVKSYIFMDVLVPAIKKAVSDIVTDGIDIILYGGSGKTKRSSTNASRVSYRSYYDNPNNDHRYDVPAARSRITAYNYDDITIPSRSEAEDVLARMEETIAEYGVVSVGDYYDLVGVTGNYTDNKYGWTSLRTADIVRSNGGYMIRLPKAIPINN